MASTLVQQAAPQPQRHPAEAAWINRISNRNTAAPLALVVDDEALLALEMEDLLAAAGFATLIACTEAAAREVPAEALRSPW